jgi:hypothetical protein
MGSTIELERSSFWTCIVDFDHHDSSTVEEGWDGQGSG